jgi:hypothetical protein
MNIEADPDETPLRIEPKIRYQMVEVASHAEPKNLKSEFEKLPISELWKYYFNCESHALFECHLPSNTSINYIEKIFVPKNDYENVMDAILQAKVTLLSDGREFASLVECADDSDKVFSAQVKYMTPTEADPIRDLLVPRITINVQGLKGIPAFLPFKTPSEGFLFGFSIKTLNDTRVCFATKESADGIMQTFPLEPQPVHYKGCINFLIGCSLNTETYIRFGNTRTFPLGELREKSLIPTFSTDEAHKPLLLKYWFLYHRDLNMVAWGRGDSPNLLCSCSHASLDTHIFQQVRYSTELPHFQAIGVSSWGQVRTYQAMFVKDCPQICRLCLVKPLQNKF